MCIESKLAARCGITEAEARSFIGGTRQWNARLHDSSVLRVEYRDKAGDRADAPRSTMQVSGYSAVFDSDSELLGGFIREQIKRGAFRKALKSDPDVRLLVNHDGLPYARTTNGTLILEERPRGLWMEAQLNERDADAVSLSHKIERGDVDQQSFAFTVAKDEWRMCECADSEDYAGCDCVWERDITQIGSLFEVSVVTFPAYPDTSVQTGQVARSSEQSQEEGAQALGGELRDTPATDAPNTGAGDHHKAEAIRLWIAANVMEVTNHEYGNERGAEACH